jgi:hypothetical protein
MLMCRQRMSMQVALLRLLISWVACGPACGIASLNATAAQPHEDQSSLHALQDKLSYSAETAK